MRRWWFIYQGKEKKIGIVPWILSASNFAIDLWLYFSKDGNNNVTYLALFYMSSTCIVNRIHQAVGLGTRVRGALILFKVPICCCPTCTEGCIATHSTARIWLASLCCFCLSSERVALDGETVGVLLFIYIFIFWLEPGLVSGGSL